MRSFRNGTVLVFCLALLAGCNVDDRKSGEVIRKVKIAPVQQADSLRVKQFPGIINAAGEMDLAFRVAGPLQKIPVKEGDYVEAGQVVARLDPRDYEVQLAAAQAKYDQVKAEAGRVIELHNRKSVAGNDYDKAVSGLKMAEANLKNARDQLNDTKLTAPVSGYVQEVHFLENELVDAGMPVVSMINVGHFQVETEIPVSLYVDRENIVSFSGLQPAVSGEKFPLHLLSYSKMASNNQLYKVHLRINPAPHPRLAPGMDVQVNMLLKNSAGPMACVPLSALFNEGGTTFVWVYQPGGTVKKREVVTGPLTGDGRIRVSSGLRIDELVVVAGVNSLNENDQVEPLEPVSKTNVGGLL